MEEYLIVRDYLLERMPEDYTMFTPYLEPLEACYQRYIENRLTENFVNFNFNRIPYFNNELRFMPEGLEDKIDNMYALFLEKAREQSNV
jgi:hypothetical protein